MPTLYDPVLFTQTSAIGLTENVKGSKGDRRKFEIWKGHKRTEAEIYTLTVCGIVLYLDTVKQAIFSRDILSYFHCLTENTKLNLEPKLNMPYVTVAKSFKKLN